MTGRLGAVCVALGLAARIVAAGPELVVGTRCDSTAVPTGGQVTVPIDFATGTGDAGQPNAVSAAEFLVTFAADAFAVTEVRLPAALAASGSWTLDWERTLGLTEVPGRIMVAVTPTFQVPLPTLASGTLAELVLEALPTDQNRCVAVEIPVGSIVFSAPPLGVAVPPGPITDGGVAINAGHGPELCGDCADNDGDQLIDLADPDCEAEPAAFGGRREKVVVKRRRGGDVRVSLRTTLPAAFEDIAGPLRVELRQEGSDPPACHGMEALVVKRTVDDGKRGYLFVSNGKKVAKLVSSLPDGRSKLVARFPGPVLEGSASPLSVAIWVGNVPFHATVPLKKSTSTGQVYR